MHQHWGNSASNSVGSTSLIANNFDQQQTPWFNSNIVQIKTEPEDFSNYMRATPPQQEMSPILTQNALDLLEQMPSFRQIGAFNPLTPPGYSGLLFPSFSSHQLNKQTTPSKPQDLSITKSKNHSIESENSSITPPMDVTPPKSPSMMDQTPEKDEQIFNGLDTRSESVESYDEESEDYEDDGLCVGAERSKKRKAGSNKPRQYKCKQCKQIFFSKGEFWEHTRTHIKPEKMLQCPKCAFVTEYKHHLEYHLRNHSRSKPFACPHCNYSCVNKSMLNSHLKSHSTVLQYRCLDCNYATKYCHSLKLHLRKYAHKPDIVLNLDGTPNPLPIIDIYGTRRGPKSKSTTSKLLAEIEKNQAQQQAQKSQLSPPLTPSTSSLPTATTNSITKTPPSSLLTSNAAMMVNMLQNKMPLFPYFNLNFQMFAAQQQHHQQQQQQQINDIINSNESNNKPEEADTNFIENSPLKKPAKRTKRKGKAFKFEEKMNLSLDHYDDNEDYVINENASTSKVVPEIDNSKVTSSVNTVNNCEMVEQSSDYECKFCGIIFKDNVLFSLHIGYHSLGDDPFKCNMCGIKTEDKIQFFLHIAKFPHA